MASDNVDSKGQSTGLLANDEQGAAIVVNAGASSPFVLLGDHAGREIPRSLKGLQLHPEAMDRHIAWDIGAADLGRALAERLDATYVAQRYSRLVIDCNRDPARADSICEISDGITIPGNTALSAADRAARVQAIFAPYHAEIARALDARSGAATALVAVHSFTPVFQGFVRPWRFGVLHREDSALSQAMLTVLRAAEGEGVVGDNEPYRMDTVDYTIPHHADARGLDYLELEVRQDLIATPEAAEAMAARLAPLLSSAARLAAGT